MTYSPGELFDKCSILQIKKEKGLDVPEYCVACKEVEELIEKDATLGELYHQLYKSNLIQYSLEDVIRSEKDLLKVGETAIKIREHNDNRVFLKNEVNKKLHYIFNEVKLYKR